MLEEIAPQSDDILVLLGDYVDRGPDSRGVIEQVLKLEQQCQVVPLLGNHEEALLDAALARLRPGGTVVANYALMDRAVEAWARLGNLVQVSVSRASAVAEGFRLAAEHPVFVTWGPA